MSSFLQASVRCDPSIIAPSLYNTERALHAILTSATSDAATNALMEQSKERMATFKEHLASSFTDTLGDSKQRSAAHQVNIYDKKCGRRFAPPVQLLPANMSLEAPSKSHGVDALHQQVRQRMLDEASADPHAAANAGMQKTRLSRRFEVLLDEGECF